MRVKQQKPKHLSSKVGSPFIQPGSEKVLKKKKKKEGLKSSKALQSTHVIKKKRDVQLAGQVEDEVYI